MDEFVVGNTVTIGGYEWRVLGVSSDKALLISEYVLEERAYHNSKEYTTWAWCDLRRYLNEEFYEKLPEELKSIILETKVPNPVNPLSEATGGSKTKDRVFLLSIHEASYYFGDDTAALQEVNEQYDYLTGKYQEARAAHNLQGEESEWWLRSPGYYSDYAAYIGDDYRFHYGRVMVGGCEVHIHKGVRPVMRVKIKD
jgi:hypothetical protein